MDDRNLLATRFEDHRGHLRAVAYRMLASHAEAEDAVQEAWLRISRAEAADIENLRGWLTTVVARICLDLLRSRKARGEDSVAQVPDPIVSRELAPAEAHRELADAVGLALIIVLETLAPAERLAFVLHDMFAMSFDAIAPIVGRTPAAARQLASRARRRVQGAARVPDADLGRQREVVDAFLAASQRGDLDALLVVLDPDVVLRGDRGPAAASVVRGARQVAKGAVFGGQRAAAAGFVELPVLVNGAAGVVVFAGDQVFSIAAFTVAGGRIVEINVLADPDRLRRLDLSAVR